MNARQLAISAEAYHADPCPAPSLSSTGARTLVRATPAAYWHGRQNPERKRVFDIGTSAHLLVLEPDLFADAVRVIDADSYRTKAAQEAREQAYAEGKVPLLPEEASMVMHMRDALFAHPVARHAFEGGTVEQTAIWQCDEFGHWCRARMDYMPPHRRYLVDYKTAASAHPEQFPRALAEFGYHQQAAWYQDAVEQLTGERPARFCFVVQEKKPPYLVSVFWVDHEALEVGRALNRLARGIFAHCLARWEWPGYQPDVAAAPQAFTVTLPPWALREFESKRDAGLLEPPKPPRAEAA